VGRLTLVTRYFVYVGYVAVNKRAVIFALSYVTEKPITNI